ncbi:BREX-1 system adenine-specific DNA-methyltransferase PglX [Paucisalibacillus globulus]|uniref:BREX-1 system adenine-specific DNA-methyltransferase PglX n=1 Tax=Paucisalibacillus globulus TaxID=351095 RepID=UPI00040B3C54|nr:BREX-1 system adenine-specific DNA-methyltransferase PglX [Paucisalibacillus globulus]
MNKAELKKFAVEARRDLLEKVSLKAEQYGITKDNVEFKIEENYGQLFVNGKSFSTEMKQSFYTLQQRLNAVGYDQLIEEVAYTWFNRIIAIRYMEVNNYLPDRVNVLSSNTGKNEPDILLQYETMTLDVVKKQINELIQNGDSEQAYRRLFVAQCNNLNENLPSLFEKINDYTELLLPDYLLDSEFIIAKLVSNSELTESFKEVEVIGWIYQYYNSEPKDKVYSNLKKNIRVDKHDIPAATQIFTPKWIVRYMVENSIGKLWLEVNPHSQLRNFMNYYLEPPTQEKDVLEIIKKIGYKGIDLEELTIIDPCVGSGHMLVYAFDLLYEIYKEAGYLSKDIPQLIIEKNLFGIDVDERSTQLASFALLMKAREKNRRILKKSVKPNIFAIRESNNLDTVGLAELICESKEEKFEFKYFIEKFYDAKNYGSLIKGLDIDYNKYLTRIINLRTDNSLQLGIKDYYAYEQLKELEFIFKQGIILNSSFDVAITNPPYMGVRNTNSDLKNFLQKNYPMTKIDTFSAMMERMEEFTKSRGIIANVTMQSWMFLSSYEKFREHILNKYSILNLVHMDNMVMGIAFGTAATIFRKKIKNYKGVFQYVKYSDIINEEPYEFPRRNSRYSQVSSEAYKNLPGNPIAYWVPRKVRTIFAENMKISDIAEPRQGMATADNNRFLRYWYEVNFMKVGFNNRNKTEALESLKKWFPYSKGGPYKKWYGNQEYLLNWENDGEELKNFKKAVIRNPSYYFKNGLTWSSLTSGNISFRYTDFGFLFDSKGPMLFLKENDSHDNYLYLLGYLNSKLVMYFLKIISPTFDFNQGPIGNLPYISGEKSFVKEIASYVEENINISKKDWNYYETSWQFSNNPLVEYNSLDKTLESSFRKRKDITDEWLSALKNNEEQINKKFIELFGLQQEIEPNVLIEDVTIRQIDRATEAVSFLSYFIGCLMGRYSLDIEGLVYGGGRLDESRYQSFKPNQNGLIQLTDDHYFDNDIIERLREFLSVAFSPNTVDENMQWLAESLKMKKNESPEERLRRYFLDEFFKDHCKIYQKRPIYWLVDSGKQKGLRTLIYMHRYQPDTMATIRFEHLQEIQSKYQNEIDMIDTRLANPSLSPADKRNLEKSKTAYQKKIEELQEFDKKLATYANEQIDIDLDDGVNVNYAKFNEVLAKIK